MKKFIFLCTLYDLEKFNRQIIILNKNAIIYNVINKTSRTSAKSPLSQLFEVEIQVAEDDFDRAFNLLI